MVPGLDDRIMNGSEEDVVHIAEMVCHLKDSSLSNKLPLKIQKGVSSAQSDDTKGLKGPILDWITPRGQSLSPPLARNVKMDRGFLHERTSALLCPAGLDWSNIEYTVDVSPFFNISSRDLESRKSCAMERCKYWVINGQCFYMQGMTTIQKIRGRGSFTALS
jgi:hypothetical protein